MRQILRIALVVLVPIPAAAQKVEVVPYPKLPGKRIFVIAQNAELRDQAKVVGTVPRGYDFQVEESDEDRYQVRWKGQCVWVARADALPLDRALHYFSTSIRGNPSAADFIARGRIRIAKQNLDGALDDFNEAIRLDPKKGWFHDNRGCVWCLKGNYLKALADFEIAVRLDPNYASTYFHRSGIFHLKGKYQKAIADLDMAIRLDPTQPYAYYIRGVIWQTLGDREKAILDYTTAIKLDPRGVAACELTEWKSLEYFDTLAAAYAEAGQFDKAVEWQQKAIELAPESEKADFETRLKLYLERKPYREELGKK